ncbi:MAG: serine acetyltransferase [Clostridia bacterium]|nr:serine acetyltransferase [Clostridia bacterium]
MRGILHMNFKKLFQSDISRYGNLRRGYIKRFHFYFRKCQTCTNPIIRRLYRFIFGRIAIKRGLEISPNTKIGIGLYLGHAFNITINEKTIIGDNCNIHKGVTIGQENRGERKGTPVIADKVWIGINATVVGNITIGEDVLIAPNAYVNCNVPSHSVVYGNPCIIKARCNATEGYINNVCK